eukprot:2630908-Prymnesium_polylepis.1
MERTANDGGGRRVRCRAVDEEAVQARVADRVGRIHGRVELGECINNVAVGQVADRRCVALHRVQRDTLAAVHGDRVVLGGVVGPPGPGFADGQVRCDRMPRCERAVGGRRERRGAGVAPRNKRGRAPARVGTLVLRAVRASVHWLQGGVPDTRGVQTDEAGAGRGRDEEAHAPEGGLLRRAPPWVAARGKPCARGAGLGVVARVRALSVKTRVSQVADVAVLREAALLRPATGDIRHTARLLPLPIGAGGVRRAHKIGPVPVQARCAHGRRSCQRAREEYRSGLGVVLTFAARRSASRIGMSAVGTHEARAAMRVS